MRRETALSHFCTFTADIRGASREPLRQSSHMDEVPDDELLAMIVAVAADVLDRIGDDAEARFRFFRDFVRLAKRASYTHQ